MENLVLLNSNKWLAGAAMLLVNLGGKYIQADLSKTHNMILSNAYVKKIIVFALFFMATRDIISAFLLTLMYIFVVDGLLHADRKFCIIPQKYIQPDNLPQKEDYDKAKAIIQKYETFGNSAKKEGDNELYLKYLSNVSLLNNL